MRTLIRVNGKGYFKKSDRAGYDITYTNDPAEARAYAHRDIAETQAHNLWLAGEGEYELIPGKTLIRHTPPKLDYTGPKGRLWRKRRADGTAENPITLFVIDGRRKWESGIEFEMGFMRHEEDARRLVALWHDAEGITTAAFEKGVIQKTRQLLTDILYKDWDGLIHAEPVNVMENQSLLLELADLLGINLNDAE